MTPKWTPGWPAGPYSMMEPAMVICGTTDHLPFVLATVHESCCGVNIEGDARKTAQLFAVAPKLYDALQALLEDSQDLLEDAAMHLGTTSKTCVAARKALAEARGEIA